MISSLTTKADLLVKLLRAQIREQRAKEALAVHKAQYEKLVHSWKKISVR